MMKTSLVNRIRHYEQQTGYQILQNYLGHGTQGIVFSLGHQVAKLTTDYQETKVAEWALANPHPYLPIIHRIEEHPKNIRAIIREPLADIESKEFLEQFRLIETLNLDAQAYHFKARVVELSWDPAIANRVIPLLLWLHENFYIRELHHFNFGMRCDQLVVRDLGTIRLNPRRICKTSRDCDGLPTNVSES